MTFEELTEIVRQCHYPNVRINAHNSDGRWYLQVTMTDFDSDRVEYGRKWYVSCHSCRNEVVQTCFKAILTFMEHEVREQFTYKGSKIFGPHYDVDVLADICRWKKNLDYRSKHNES